MQQLLLATTTDEVSQIAEQAIPNRSLLFYADMGIIKIKYNDIMRGIIAYPDDNNIIFDAHKNIALDDFVTSKGITVTPDDKVSSVIEMTDSIAVNGRYILLLKRNMTTDSGISGIIVRNGPLVKSSVEFTAMANGQATVNATTTEHKKPTIALVSYNGIEYVALAFSEAYSCKLYFSGFDGRSKDVLPPKIGTYTDQDIKTLRMLV